MNKFDLNNKNAIITGGAQGFGLDIAKRFLQSGAKVIIWDSDDKELKKASKLINDQNLSCDVVDVSDSKSVDDTVNKITSKTKIDILINNASAIGLFNSETLPTKQFDLMNDINLRGTYLCSKICLKHLKKSKNPHILNMSPPISLKPKWFENFTAYTMDLSKEYIEINSDYRS